MKSSACLRLVIFALMFASSLAVAQYKAPSQYFRKDSPGVNKGGQPPAGAPGAPSPAAPKTPAATARPTFKDVSVNAQFYFLNDTNRAYPWTKLSATTAKNAKGATQTFPAGILVQK